MRVFSWVSEAAATLTLAAALLAGPVQASTLYADFGERAGLTRIASDMLQRSPDGPAAQRQV